MTTNWRDKWQERTRGGYEVLDVRDDPDVPSDWIVILWVGYSHKMISYEKELGGQDIRGSDSNYDLLPITPPADVVPQGYAEITIGGVKTIAKMDTASSLVVEHHVSGGTLMMVADDLADLRRDAERWQYENKQLRLILQSAKHLLMAATGPEDGPTSWIETRDRLFDRMKTYSVDALPDPAT